MRSTLLRLALAVSLGLLPACASMSSPPAAAPPPAVSVTSTDLDAYLSQPELAFSGAVLVAQDGRVLLSKGYGQADRRQGLANTPQTRFRIGDLTMAFTALAVLMLQADGQLDVQDPACQYLADCPAAWQPITLHHLLTHSAGLPALTPGEINRAAASTPEAIAAGLRDKPLDFQPGERFGPSPGYLLLGLIIEKVSGQAYEAFLQERIFTPLGMTSTGLERAGDSLPVSYTWDGSAVGTTLSGMWAGGALYSTVEDLYRWDQALYTDQLLPHELLDEMFAPQVRFPGAGAGHYGYGWAIEPESGHPVWFDTAVYSGFGAGLYRYPDDHLTVIVLSNSDASLVYQRGPMLAKQVLFGAAAPLGAAYSAMAYDAQSGQVIYFGGAQSDRMGGKLIDPETWAFDVRARTWTAMHPARAPTPVWGVQNAMTYDSESDRVILFGGSPDTYTAANSAETWAYDYDSNTWTKRAGGPPGRSFHTLAYDAESDRVILFGGLDFQVGSEPPNMTPLGDAWAYDYNADTWIELTSAAGPGPRGGHVMAYDARMDRLILWGGFIAGSTPTYSREVWTYDYNANGWARRRDSHMVAGALTYDVESGRVVGYGGIAMVDGNPAEDAVWTYDYGADTWYRLALLAPRPQLRWGENFVYLPGLDRIMLFGGARTVPVTEAWLYDLDASRWEQVAMMP